MNKFGCIQNHKKRRDMTDAQTLIALKNEVKYRIKRGGNVSSFLLEKIRKLEASAGNV